MTDSVGRKFGGHLRVLRRTGLVTEQELPDDARVRMYQIEPRAFRELRGWLEEVLDEVS